ncbi:nucleoside phosphorylase [Snuella sedimenti]|uniref:Uridine phosphorylase n=1 Tax=Snuella sedimenti TaxID=2798802 RepID=A0A8J7J6B4_9FLAO|nr:nucleoside phosphorylase [Snuella sedimenti]MBJ6369224.1 nucleoside phosphorylase [Snuella sedimenti]
MPIKESELILNSDGSIYHLNLKPEHLATTVLLVGDQNRVEKITNHFDKIECTIQKREFKTQTGTYRGKRISVISTGIGADNIDIVLNELDALVNIDFATRTVKKNLTRLDVIRIGTSGAIQKEIPVNSFLLSTYGLDITGMLHAYNIIRECDTALGKAFVQFTNWKNNKATPLFIKANDALKDKFDSSNIHKGITVTSGGFYGPQGRVLRLALQDPELNTKFETFTLNGLRITNLEMETSAIYGLAKLLGHQAISLNAILANRTNGTFSEQPEAVIESLISYTLDRL